MEEMKVGTIRWRVHAQQYQKQQGQTPAILRRSCSLETNDPQRPTFHIARRRSFHVDRFSHPTVDQHPTFIVDRSTSFDIDRYYTVYIDPQTEREWMLGSKSVTTESMSESP
ncbi:hypothetical protein F2Q68_00010235 [Brassica cretica]|uniref:Uncharacterized protein n=1 Tax=Brassica cretica TaxID=69181 RepID=A0A8S9KY03_BRACR|nr:hypothetical protein F2Q68_00010235 [Brassica cretica]